MKAHYIIAVLFVLSVGITVQAGIYKWVDSNGKTHFTDAKPNSSATAIKTVEEKAYPVAPAPADTATAPAAAAVLPVDIYITSWCPYCKKAQAFMRSNNIPFNVYDIEQDLNAAARKESLDPDFSGVPLTVINGSVIRGFDEDTYGAKLLRQKP